MADLPPTPAINKEREKVPLKEEVPKRVPIVEVRKIPEKVWKEAEEEGYLERVEKEVELEKPVTDDSGQVLVTAPSAEEPKIVLPLSEETYLNPESWRQPVTQAIRWLVTWVKRIVKMYPGRTVFKR